MYADRVEAESKRSIKDRLNGTSIADTRRRQFTGKRFAFAPHNFIFLRTFCFAGFLIFASILVFSIV